MEFPTASDVNAAPPNAQSNQLSDPNKKVAATREENMNRVVEESGVFQLLSHVFASLGRLVP